MEPNPSGERKLLDSLSMLHEQAAQIINKLKDPIPESPRGIGPTPSNYISAARVIVDDITIQLNEIDSIVSEIK